jgi:hypothetical protein
MNDAPRRRLQTKLLDPHPPPPYSLTEDAPRDRSIRLLGPKKCEIAYSPILNIRNTKR